jgi:D-alanine-D-alanine ligase
VRSSFFVVFFLVERMPAQRIMVLFNEPTLSAGHPNAASEHEVVQVSQVIAKVLSEAGFEVSRLGVGTNPNTLLHGLKAQQPDAVFNLFEGWPDDGRSEAFAACLLEWQGVPFTGSPSQALCLARNKPLTKYLFQGARLPTPDFLVVERLPLEELPRRWPVIVKPGLQDASEGIDQGSVVQGSDQLVERVAYLLETYGPPVLVERFIPGREFNVSVIDSSTGLLVLPLCEIVFSAQGSAHRPIVSYDAKWRPDSSDFKATPPHFPKEMDPRLAKELADLARRAFRLVGCRDYARFDFRVSPKGKPYVIEVNPNPCISPDSGLTRAVEASGQTYAGFLVDVTRAALARGKLRAGAGEGQRPGNGARGSLHCHAGATP